MGKASEEGQGPSGAVEPIIVIVVVIIIVVVMGTPHSIINVTQTSLLPQSWDSPKSINK